MESSFAKIVSLNSNNNTKTSIDDLPNDLVINIFSRLPVKTLLHSTCVNNKWLSIIKTPTLISAHLSRSLSDDAATYIFLIHKIIPQINVFSDNGRRLIRYPDLNLPFETRSGPTLLVGACNGLICLTDHSDNQYDGRDLYLLNPFINKFRKLDVDSSTYVDLIAEISSDKTVDIFVGFGYSEVENDHKVVRIITRRSDANRRGFFTPKVEIYSLKSGKWKRVDVSNSIKTKKPSSSDIAVFAQGCLYWHVDYYEKHDDYLLCFNLKDESFIKIKLPATYHELKGTWDRCIVSKNDSVAVILHTYGRNDSMKICVFVLEKKFEDDGWVYNWKEIKYQCAEFSIKKCLGFSRDHGRLIMTWGFPEKYLVAIDNSGAMEKVLLYNSIDDYVYGSVNVFETLVLLSD